MVGVATEGGGGGGRGAAGSAYRSPFDLSKYLPGGENDPNAKRAPASADLRGQGITAAGDVSNFEKINRIMQRKRAMLKP